MACVVAVQPCRDLLDHDEWRARQASPLARDRSSVGLIFPSGLQTSPPDADALTDAPDAACPQLAPVVMWPLVL